MIAGKVTAWLKLVRFPNLIIVALTQFLLEFWILVPAFHKAGIDPILDFFHFSLLSLVTLIIAASGYIINDLEDEAIDQINKPQKQIIGKFIAVKKATWGYWSLVILGFLLSLYLADYVRNHGLVLIYPSAVFLLWWYSKLLKKVAFWGNFVVALFCAFVAGIVLFAEREAFLQLIYSNTEIGDVVAVVFGVYFCFALLSTLFREIIKDMEDIEGDQKEGCQTIPVVFGIEKSRIITILVGLLLLLVLGAFTWWLWKQSNYFSVGFVLFFIFSPILYTMYILSKAKTKQDFARLSKWTKLILLGGLFLLFLAR